MRWAVAFLPSHIRQLMNLLASLELYRGSGLRFSALAVRLRAMVVSCGSVNGRFGGQAVLAVGRDRVHGPVRLEIDLVDAVTGGAGDLDGGDGAGARGQALAGTFQRHTQGMVTATTGEVQDQL